MRIDQLKQIIKITECGSINKAASELYTSQSNLSQSVQSLEDEIGQTIFLRTGKGVELTKFGAEFCNYIQATLEQFKLTQDFCKNYSREPPLKFSVASQYMRFANLLFIEIYKKNASRNSEFSFLECSFLDILSNVNTHHAEIGLVLISRKLRKVMINLITSRGLLYHPILVCPAAITVGEQNPLYHSKQSTVTLDMLSNFPLAVYRDINFNFPSEYSEIDPYAQRDRIIVSDRNTLHEILRSTDAYSIAAYTNAYEKIAYYENIRALKLQDQRFFLELGWIRNASRPLSNLGKEYIRMIENSQITA